MAASAATRRRGVRDAGGGSCASACEAMWCERMASRLPHWSGKWSEHEQWMRFLPEGVLYIDDRGSRAAAALVSGASSSKAKKQRKK